jgi:hypothetical protein
MRRALRAGPPAATLRGPLPRAAGPAARGAGPCHGARGTRRGDRGVASLEYLGMLPFLLLIALAGIQLGIVAYCAEQAGTAARTAARTAAQPDPHADATQAGHDAVSGWVNPAISWPRDDTTTVTATATVRIPSVLPGLSLFDPVSRSATMPKEDDSTP